MKNKQRKILFYFSTTFITIFLVVVIVLMFVLVSTKSMFDGISSSFEKTMVVPNSPVEKDGGFNEETIKGAGNYALDMQSLGYDDKVGKITPSIIDSVTEYKKVLDAAYYGGADVLASSGYNITNTLIGEQTTNSSNKTILNQNGVMFQEENKEKYFVLADDASYDNAIARNVISIRFESSEVGFIAGIAASVYATWNKSFIVSTYGGMQFSTVYDFMSGYEQGINWYNYYALGYDINHEFVGTPLVKEEYQGNYVKLTNGEYFVDYTNNAKDSTSWFTGSFNLGDGISMTDKQLDKNSSVIFPVAGGQTGDSISEAAKQNNVSKNEKDYVKVIGVDSDATKTYPANEREILGSATKEIAYSIELMLWYVNKFIFEYDQNPNLVPENELEQQFKEDIILSDEVGGWQESNPIYTSKDFSRMSSEEEIENYISNNNGIYRENTNYMDYGRTLENGAMFVGNYANEGVNFVKTSPLDLYISEIYNETITFDELVAIAFDQNSTIENASTTFSGSSNSHRTESNQYQWIPDWENTYN